MLSRFVFEESLAGVLLQQTFMEYSKHSTHTFPTLPDLTKTRVNVLRNSEPYSVEELKEKSRDLVATNV
jgi:hypothetical protein